MNKPQYVGYLAGFLYERGRHLGNDDAEMVGRWNPTTMRYEHSDFHVYTNEIKEMATSCGWKGFDNA